MINDEVVVWHELDGDGDVSRIFIERLFEEVGLKYNIKFKIIKMNISEYIVRLNNLEKEDEKPDIIFIPQDMVNIEGAKLSEVPAEYNTCMDSEIWNTMQYKGIQKGVPYLQGNHAVLYYNKKYLAEKPNTWDEIMSIKNTIPICVDLKTEYWILPFLCTMVGYPLKNEDSIENKDKIINLENMFKDLINQNKLVSYNAIDAMLDKFINGEVASIINGEWMYAYLKEKLGEDLGVATLPAINGVQMKGVTSTVGIAFPNNSLNSNKRESIEKFINSILSYDNQMQWLNEYKRLPVNGQCLKNIDNLEEGMSQILKQKNINYFMYNDEKMDLTWEVSKEISKNTVL